MSDIFRFKQFNVDQAGCGMRVNTDGVLLGALASAGSARKILDIGTGTGVIALMLAQRFERAGVNAVEIDSRAAAAARENFRQSPFTSRLDLFEGYFQQLSGQPGHAEYDVIVSNPPFFIDSLRNKDIRRSEARHATTSFYEDMASFAASHLSGSGTLVLILPEETNRLMINYAARSGLYPLSVVSVSSFESSEPHRYISTFSFERVEPLLSRFVIYKSRGVYSTQYRNALENFLTIF